MQGPTLSATQEGMVVSGIADVISLHDWNRFFTYWYIHCLEPVYYAIVQYTIKQALYTWYMHLDFIYMV